jgi:hypothetical protein
MTDGRPTRALMIGQTKGPPSGRAAWEAGPSSVVIDLCW